MGIDLTPKGEQIYSKSVRSVPKVKEDMGIDLLPKVSGSIPHV